MSKYCKLLIIPSAIVLIISVFSGFRSPSQAVQVKELLEQRTEILQKAYYGEIALSDAEKRLAAIETQPLLAEDIQGLRETAPSEVDLVERMDVLKIKQKTNLFGYLTYEMDLKWYMRGLAQDYVHEGSYFVVLQSSGDTYKLSEFGPN